MFKLIIAVCAVVGLSSAILPIRFRQPGAGSFDGSFMSGKPILSQGGLSQWNFQQFNDVTVTPLDGGLNLCDMCVAVVKYAKSVADDNQLKAMAQLSVQQATQNMPFTQQQLILGVFNQYLQVAENYIANPVDVCAKVGVCPSQNQTVIEFFRIPPLNTNTFCAPCQADMNTWANKIKEITLQGNPLVFDRMWSDFCAKIQNSNYRSFCTGFMQAYGPTMTAKVVQYLNAPASICTSVGICNAKLPAVSPTDNCLVLAAKVANVQAQYNFQPEVLRKSATACDMLPPTFQVQCAKYLGMPLLKTAEALENKLIHCQTAKAKIGQHSQLLTTAANEILGLAAQSIAVPQQNNVH